MQHKIAKERYAAGVTKLLGINEIHIKLWATKLWQNHDQVAFLLVEIMGKRPNSDSTLYGAKYSIGTIYAKKCLSLIPIF